MAKLKVSIFVKIVKRCIMMLFFYLNLYGSTPHDIHSLVNSFLLIVSNEPLSSLHTERIRWANNLCLIQSHMSKFTTVPKFLTVPNVYIFLLIEKLYIEHYCYFILFLSFNVRQCIKKSTLDKINCLINVNHVFPIKFPHCCFVLNDET